MDHKFDRVKFWKDPLHVEPWLKHHNNGKFFKFTQPEFYLKMDYSSRILKKFIPKYAQKDWTFLEYGCSVGKCLSLLRKMGYFNLKGIEINPHAIELCRQNFPELKDVEIINAPLEDVVTQVRKTDCIYGVGVLMHLPYELDWVIEKLVKKARRMFMTSENEVDGDFHKFPRNYRKFIEPFGWKQVEEETGADYPPLPASTIIRVFLKEKDE